MSKELTEDAQVKIICKECGHTVKRPLRWLRSNTSLKCEGEGCESEVPSPLGEYFIDTADPFKEMVKTFRGIKKDVES